MGQCANGLWRKQRVGVEGDYYFTFCITQSDVECCRLTPSRRRNRHYPRTRKVAHGLFPCRIWGRSRRR